ncbi:hypothetical protein [Haloarcula onubensis]|uniref:Uncharacterized protein n=1 Tax=Haloarcula onubensis TaxID=2950539 RepID=A0ABU2FVJ1_9EURY|nr:hypothetical protein [Halomicroarcula sp. S3CR25-11]MDS0284464.1 hypothetical protein [Halomicroarcula sp. S3CR25-11]
MQLAHEDLMLLLNGLYELGEESFSVVHPAEEIGELLRIDLGDATESTVSITTGAVTYEDALDEIERTYGRTVRRELPNEAAYVKAVTASRLVDIQNREEVNKVISRYGYQDLQEGHPPRYAGFDTNLLPWRMHEVLGIDPERHTTSGGRAPVNGYALLEGVDTELSISYRYGKNAMPATALADAFGPEYERLAGQPTEDNRETRLGLREYRRLRETRPHDIVSTGTGDTDIIDGCAEYYADKPTGVILFSNDYGFVDEARSRKVPAVHVDFSIDFPRRVTGKWDQIATLLYGLAVIFGVLILPRATLYGVWEGKSERNWKREEIDIDTRSEKLATILERDKPIVEAHAARQ